MWNLSDIRARETCTIVWLLGRMGNWLRSQLNFCEDDEIRVVQNYGEGGMIVRHKDHTYALSEDAIRAVRVCLH